MGFARRGSAWRTWIVALAITLACATFAAAICTTFCLEEQTSDHDCAVCHHRHQPVAEPPASLQIGFADASERFVPTADGEWIVFASPRRQPARAPPS